MSEAPDKPEDPRKRFPIVAGGSAYLLATLVIDAFHPYQPGFMALVAPAGQTMRPGIILMAMSSDRDVTGYLELHWNATAEEAQKILQAAKEMQAYFMNKAREA